MPPADDPLSAELQAQLDELRRRFTAGLAARLTAIETACDPTEREALLHRLAGAAGAYGLDGLGQAARQALLASQHGQPERCIWWLNQLRVLVAEVTGPGAPGGATLP